MAFVKSILELIGKGQKKSHENVNVQLIFQKKLCFALNIDGNTLQ